jgi:Ner family transcriptional regulator
LAKLQEQPHLRQFPVNPRLQRLALETSVLLERQSLVAAADGFLNPSAQERPIGHHRHLWKKSSTENQTWLTDVELIFHSDANADLEWKILSTKRDGWHRQDIMAEVRKRGSSLAGVGRGLGLSRSTMAWALMKPHPRANAAIATFIGKSMHELWPEWFDASGKRVLVKSVSGPSRRKPASGRRQSLARAPAAGDAARSAS